MLKINAASGERGLAANLTLSSSPENFSAGRAA